MSVLDDFPTIIRLPLRAIFGITTFLLVVAGIVGIGFGLYFILTGIVWLYMTYDVVFWTANSLALLAVLAFIGAWMEN